MRDKKKNISSLGKPHAIKKSSKQPHARILMLEKDDPQKELEFEVAYMRSLTLRQRCNIMQRLMNGVIKEKMRHGHKVTPEIIEH
ncbi:MAG: hypothetical protein ACHQQQ_12370 [Bacteroidota bacterium]